METEKRWSEMDIRACLEQANASLSSSSPGEHRNLRGLTRDKTEAKGAPVREDPKVQCVRRLKA